MTGQLLFGTDESACPDRVGGRLIRSVGIPGRTPTAMRTPRCSRCLGGEASTPELPQELERQLRLLRVADTVLDQPAVPDRPRRGQLLHDEQARCRCLFVSAKPHLHLSNSGVTVGGDTPLCGDALVALLPQPAVECGVGNPRRAQSQTLRTQLDRFRTRVLNLHRSSLPCPIAQLDTVPSADGHPVSSERWCHLRESWAGRAAGLGDADRVPHQSPTSPGQVRGACWHRGRPRRRGGRASSACPRGRGSGSGGGADLGR